MKYNTIIYKREVRTLRTLKKNEWLFINIQIIVIFIFFIGFSTNLAII